MLAAVVCCFVCLGHKIKEIRKPAAHWQLLQFCVVEFDFAKVT